MCLAQSWGMLVIRVGAPGGSLSTAQLPLTHPGLPHCGCFCIQWPSANFPPSASSMFGFGAASLTGAAGQSLWDCRTWTAPGTPQLQPQHFVTFNFQGTAVASASPVLPLCFPRYQDMEQQFAQFNLSNVATSVGAAPGSNIPPHISNCAAPHIQAAGDTAGDHPLPKETPLDCFLPSQDGPSSIPTPGDSGGTSRAISPCTISSLSLPEELLSPDYGIPKTSNTIRA